jgi:hypothetical protein
LQQCIYDLYHAKCYFHVFKTDAANFTFSSYYHDHMVLQQSSAGTSIWGHSSKIGDVVHIKLNTNEVARATVDRHQIWQATFTSPAGHGPYTVSAMSSLGTIHLSDVLFGDVWVCSGQSNMEYIVPGVKWFNLSFKQHSLLHSIIYLYIPFIWIVVNQRNWRICRYCELPKHSTVSNS